MDLTGKRAVVMGLGRFGGGVGAVRYLVRRGADVLVTDGQPEGKLRNSLEQLRGLPDVTYRLGEHNVADFTTADLIVVNPAVDRRNNRYLRAAQAGGVALTSEIELLVRQLPNRARTVGITGTAGKSTATAMLGHVLNKTVAPRTWVGGNIGGSLLDSIEEIGSDDWVVLELSSFMLDAMACAWSPHIAVVVHLAPNHLDRHGSFACYVAAKQRIVSSQQAGDWAILGPQVARLIDVASGRAIEVNGPSPLVERLSVPGEHNRINASLVLATARCCAVAAKPAAEALVDFRGLPHRLELAGVINGARCYNDSKSTTPDSARLAIDSFAGDTVHAILGGFDKGSDLAELARHAAGKCRAIYTLGATGDALAAAARQAHGCEVFSCGDLHKAMHQAIGNASSGQVVLLSPGCASWDQFENYEQRGELFKNLVDAFAAKGCGERTRRG